MSNTNYLVAATIILLLGIGLIFLPEKINKKEMPPEQMLLELQNDKRFIPIDQLTQRLVQEDPTLLLVDVRAPEAYEKFTLSGAINIPSQEILEEEYDIYFGRKELDIVFFSTDNFLAEKAWMIKKRQNQNSVYVLKGGLNHWVEDILKAEMPGEEVSDEERALQSFRVAARKYYVGASRALTPGDSGGGGEKKESKKIILPVKAVQKSKSEGC